MIKTRAVGAALIAATIAATVAVLPANGQPSTGGRTLTFTSTQKHGEERFIDLAPKGPSAGDRVTLSTELRGSDDVPGRLAGDCAWVSKAFAVLQCDIVVILPDGRLSLQGAHAGKPIPGVGGTQERYAVTGGTGAYEGATGTMRRDGNGERDTLTVALAP